jgi:hypothetical protein
LCLVFSQITRMTPLRLIILHFLQIFLTEGLTFIRPNHLHLRPSQVVDFAQYFRISAKRKNHAVGQPSTEGAPCPAFLSKNLAL